MDFIGTLLAVIVISILISSAFYYALNARGPWGSFWTFFLILLLVVWASSLWIRPIGPAFYGVSWVPLFFAGLVIAILLAAIPPASPHHKHRSPNKKEETDSRPEDGKKGRDLNRTLAMVSGFFWILIIFLMIVIIFGYMV